jgi:NAD(P)-dependent dehydrogenase (short-subunit alcohol dehydrogenase family)
MAASEVVDRKKSAWGFGRAYKAAMSALAGRRIVITGISRGVGFETAKLFLKEGAQIVGVARDPERLERAKKELDPGDGRLSVLAEDLTHRDASARVKAHVEAHFDALDVLFNNAAVQIDGSVKGVSNVSDAVMDQAFGANLFGPYWLARALLPLLVRGREPRLVNVSSGAGNMESMRLTDIPSYRLTKWALNGLTMLLAGELAGKVAVNAFDPGWVKTALGGPNAPGHPSESAKGALAIVTMPFSESGKFWKDGKEIPF